MLSFPFLLEIYRQRRKFCCIVRFPFVAKETSCTRCLFHIVRLWVKMKKKKRNTKTGTSGMENDLMKRDNSFCGNFNFRKFRCYRCCYLFIYEDRTDSWYAHAHVQRTQTNHTMQWFQRFHCYPRFNGCWNVLFFSFLFFSVGFAFVCALRAILKLRISTNTHTIRIEYHIINILLSGNVFFPLYLYLTDVHRAHNIRNSH